MWVLGYGFYVHNDVVEYCSAAAARAIYISTVGDHYISYSDGSGLKQTSYYPFELPSNPISIGAVIDSGSDVRYKLYALTCNSTSNKWSQLGQVGYTDAEPLTIPSGATHWMAAIQKGSAGSATVTKSDTDKIQFIVKNRMISRHNVFAGYTYIAKSDGVIISVLSNDTVEITTRSNNKNSTQFYLGSRYVWDEIKDKQCTITWTIESEDTIDPTGTDSSGNITIGTFTQQNQTSGDAGQYRIGKIDLTTPATFLGTHTVTFIPQELFAQASQETAAYFGWNFGVRSKTAGQVFYITQFDFDVVEEIVYG